MNCRSLILLVVLALPPLTGCAQVRGQVEAESLEGPVSLTPHVYDSKGRIYSLGRDLEQVGTFSTGHHFLAAFYGLAPPWWTWDASEYLNKVMRRFEGDAIVNLTLEVDEITPAERLLAIFTQVTPMIPIWIEVRLSGLVVKKKELVH